MPLVGVQPGVREGYPIPQNAPPSTSRLQLDRIVRASTTFATFPNHTHQAMSAASAAADEGRRKAEKPRCTPDEARELASLNPQVFY
jgi:hypothetical protein